MPAAAVSLPAVDAGDGRWLAAVVASRWLVAVDAGDCRPGPEGTSCPVDTSILAPRWAAAARLPGRLGVEE